MNTSLTLWSVQDQQVLREIKLHNTYRKHAQMDQRSSFLATSGRRKSKVRNNSDNNTVYIVKY